MQILKFGLNDLYGVLMITNALVTTDSFYSILSALPIFSVFDYVIFAMKPFYNTSFFVKI